jgi:hypothetical protein
MLVLANNHWNFDVRGFNPGGNHGSFFRVSTHSTLMLAGGAATRIPRALVISEPYDSLSFVPTILALTDRLPQPAQISHARLDERPRLYPGRIINELFDPQQTPTAHPAAGSAARAPDAAGASTEGLNAGARIKAEVSP